MALDMVAPLKFLQQERAIIQHHHERYDGTGYPDGLSGEAIPLGARIIAVADTFDAMNSRRAYRNEVYTHETIKEEILTNAGVQFDPKVVDAFLQVVEEKPDLWIT